MDYYAVFGNPIKHSQSPYVHQAFAKQFDHHIDYQRILAPLEQPQYTFQQFFEKGQGANVTLPFKEVAFEFCDDNTPRAKKAGATNTIIKQTDGRLLGDNTDGVGLVRDLISNNITLAGKNILLLGAGGAAKGAIAALLEAAPANLHIANRTESKALALGELWSESVTASGLTNFPDVDFDIVINSTSASLSGNLPEIDPKVLAKVSVSYDMFYAKEVTLFNRWIKQQANQTAILLDGLGMLVEQAAESYYLWHKVMPETASVKLQLRSRI